MTNRTDAKSPQLGTDHRLPENGTSSKPNGTNGTTPRSSRSRSSRSNQDDADADEVDAPAEVDPDADADADAHADAHSTRRQRSSELAGLGLAHVGDGEDEVLAPRRSKRAQQDGDDSPLEGSAAHPRGDDETSAAAPPADPDPDADADADAEADPDPDPEHDPAAIPQTSTPAGDVDDIDVDAEGVTRCICGSNDEDIGLMIQCENCKCWQHCSCMGMHREEDCPDVYYCEQCRPEEHIPLLRSLGFLISNSKASRKGAANSAAAKEAAAKELQDARDAVAELIKKNEKRRADGMSPIATGATTLPPAPATASTPAQAPAPTATGRGQRRLTSESHDHPNGAGATADSHASSSSSSSAGRKSPKRRSTMNSRDSGWEPIPPGLLHEAADNGDIKEEQENLAPTNGKKRKRESKDTKFKRDEETSPSPAASPSVQSATGTDKRRRMSGSAAPVAAASSRRGSHSDDETEEVANVVPSSGSASKKGGKAGGSGGGGGGGGGGAGKGRTDDGKAGGNSASVKQPNQYTYRNGKDRGVVGSSAAAAVSSATRTVSPTPSPSKSGRRGAAALRDGSSLPSRTGTPIPGSSSSSKASSWALPDHLSHLVDILPTPVPEALRIPQPTTRGVSNTHAAAASSSSASSRPSPHAFQTLELNEQATKVRWPSKRTTMSEAKKRIRNLGDLIGKFQIESAERRERCSRLGIQVDYPRSTWYLQREVSRATSSGTSTPTTRATEEQEEPRDSVVLFEEIARDLHSWQVAYGGVPTGTGGGSARLGRTGTIASGEADAGS